MSRDWTPREHLAAEQFNIENGLGSIWDFLERTKFHNLDGTVYRICSDEELVLRKQFPYLGKLLSNGFANLYVSLSKINGGLELLHSKDEELAVYIESGKGDENSALIKWFNGTLDENFYYSEYNHKLFAESVLEEAKEHACPYLDEPSLAQLVEEASRRSNMGNKANAVKLNEYEKE